MSTARNDFPSAIQLKELSEAATWTHLRELEIKDAPNNILLPRGYALDTRLPVRLLNVNRENQEMWSLHFLINPISSISYTQDRFCLGTNTITYLLHVQPDYTIRESFYVGRFYPLNDRYILVCDAEDRPEFNYAATAQNITLNLIDTETGKVVIAHTEALMGSFISSIHSAHLLPTGCLAVITNRSALLFESTATAFRALAPTYNFSSPPTQTALYKDCIYVHCKLGASESTHCFYYSQKDKTYHGVDITGLNDFFEKGLHDNLSRSLTSLPTAVQERIIFGYAKNFFNPVMQGMLTVPTGSAMWKRTGTFLEESKSAPASKEEFKPRIN